MAKETEVASQSRSGWRWRRFRFRLMFLPIAAIAMIMAMNLSAVRPQNLGLLNGRLYPLPTTPSGVSTEAVIDSQAMSPIPYEGSAREAMAGLTRVINRQSRMAIVSQREDYLHVEARGFVLQFVDDIEFLIVPRERVIHFRAVARTGYSDLGRNRRRMRELTEQIARELTSAGR